jgi:hypothetical protein
MNTAEQKSHRTVTQSLDKRLSDVEQVTTRLMHNGDALYLGSEGLTRRVAELEDRMLMQDEEIAALRKNLSVSDHDGIAFRTRSLWQRIVWLATGR